MKWKPVGVLKNNLQGTDLLDSMSFSVHQLPAILLSTVGPALNDRCAPIKTSSRRHLHRRSAYCRSWSRRPSERPAWNPGGHAGNLAAGAWPQWSPVACGPASLRRRALSTRPRGQRSGLAPSGGTALLGGNQLSGCLFCALFKSDILRNEKMCGEFIYERR